MKSELALIGLAAIFAMPANALDGTRTPANPPVIGIPPGNADFTRQLQCGAADLLAQANPGGATLKEQLIGAWTLVSCDGVNGVEALWCAGSNGIHTIDANGHYAMIITARGRPKFTEPAKPRNAYSAEEYKAATVGLLTQFGTWSVNEADKTITYHIDGALFPNVEGTNPKRTVSLSGDELKLVGGLDQTVWRRIKK
jgi:Lipocalin-like domain